MISYFGKENYKKQENFRFDRALCSKEEIRDLIQTSWTSPIPESVIRKLDKCRIQIINWTKENKTNNMLHIREAQAALEKELSADLSYQSLINSITKTLKLAYSNEE